MGSFIEINDTLQLTREQGFPPELDLDKHQQKPFTAADFEGRIFTFHNKPDIRVYQQVPIRVFLVENKQGKWLYWGIVHVLEVTHNYVRKITSGKFKIVYLYSPKEMELAYQLIDRNSKKNVFLSGDRGSA